MTRKRRKTLSFSLLEPRLMLAADIFVNMTADENDGIDIGGVSLREAVQRAEQAEVSRILFTDDLQNQTILLDAAFGALEINDDLTIDGQGKNVSIRGEDVTNVFKITGGDVTIKNLTLPTVVIESGSTTKLSRSVVGDLINNGTLAPDPTVESSDETECGSSGLWDCWLWYSPSNGAVGGGRLPDFMDLFTDEAQWENVRGKTGVLFLRSAMVNQIKDTGFIEDHLVPKLNEWEMRLALDVGGATWAKCLANPAAKTNKDIALLDTIAAAGGTVSYLALQSVLSKPLPNPLPEYLQPNCPPYTMTDRYEDVANYITIVKGLYPEVQIGILDALLAHGDDAQTIYGELAAKLSSVDQAIEFVLFDHPYHHGEKSGITSWSSLQSLEAFVRMELGIPTGLYHVSSTGGKVSDQQFYSDVIETQDHFSAVGGSPDYHILSSWYPFPKQELPEDATPPNYPMTTVLSTLSDHIESANIPPNGHIGVMKDDGVLTGWVLDENNPLLSSQVALYVDGPLGQGTSVGVFIADVPRPDVNAVTGLPGDHGFNVPIPDWLQDGQSHDLYVYAVDSRAMGLEVLLPESPFGFTLSP